MGGAFDITGAGTAVLAGLFALGTVAAVTWSWPRLAGPGSRNLVGRIVAQLLVTTMVAVAVGVAANRHGLWFVTWNDLATVLTGPRVKDDPHQGAHRTPTTGPDLGAWGAAGAPVTPSAPPTIDRRTGLRTYRVTGPASGHTGTVYVWSPRDPSPATPMPAIEVFHGYPVSAQSAFANLRLGRHVHEVLGDALLVIPDWSPGEVDTECVDGPAGRLETWLTTDVPAWAVKTLGARPERAAWATLGYSAGGWCAAMTAMRHPHTYAAAISLGGYMRPQFSPHYRPFRPEGSPYDLPLLAGRNPPPVSVLLQFSDHDVHVAPSSKELVAAARPPLSVTGWNTPDSGHRVGAWEPLIPDALTWLRPRSAAFGG